MRIASTVNSQKLGEEDSFSHEMALTCSGRASETIQTAPLASSAVRYVSTLPR
jgi:hypothetical protein